MPSRIELAAAHTQSILALNIYIAALFKRCQTLSGEEKTKLTNQATALADLRSQLENAALSVQDNSSEMNEAIRDLMAANKRIADEIATSKEFQETVQTAAAIAGIIARVITMVA